MRNVLFQKDCEKVVHAFISSKLQHTTVYSGISQSLHKSQVVEYVAARILTKTKKFDLITPVLAHIHWPPRKVQGWLIVLFVLKAVNGLTPTYISNLLTPYIPSRSPQTSF